MISERKIVIIAGPNGAGKTTFAREFLPNEAGCPIFVNADLGSVRQLGTDTQNPCSRRFAVTRETRPLEDPDIKSSEAALLRAAHRALELGRRTHTPVWVLKDGRLVDLASEEESSEQRQDRR
jgi:ATPase subunit of ABC transporter with duplicated ATPase domains